MKLSLKHIGSYGGNASPIIELTVSNALSGITEDIVDRNGRVEEDLIANLREVANDLEEHNNLIDLREVPHS